jgi:hypothetical protein
MASFIKGIGRGVEELGKGVGEGLLEAGKVAGKGLAFAAKEELKADEVILKEGGKLALAAAKEAAKGVEAVALFGFKAVEKATKELAKEGLHGAEALAHLGVKGVEDLGKIGIKSAEELGKLSVKGVKALGRIGIKGAKDLEHLGVKGVEGFEHLGIHGVDDLRRLGFRSAKELEKFGVKGAKELEDIGIKGAHDLEALGRGHVWAHGPKGTIYSKARDGHMRHHDHDGNDHVLDEGVAAFAGAATIEAIHHARHGHYPPSSRKDTAKNGRKDRGRKAQGTLAQLRPGQTATLQKRGTCHNCLRAGNVTVRQCYSCKAICMHCDNHAQAVTVCDNPECMAMGASALATVEGTQDIVLRACYNPKTGKYDKIECPRCKCLFKDNETAGKILAHLTGECERIGGLVGQSQGRRRVPA